MSSLLSIIGFDVEDVTGGHIKAMGGCVGKAAFDTPQLAEKVAKRKRTKSRNRKRYATLAPYRCGRCGLFHLGTKK